MDTRQALELLGFDAHSSHARIEIECNNDALMIAVEALKNSVSNDYEPGMTWVCDVETQKMCYVRIPEHYEYRRQMIAMSRELQMWRSKNSESEQKEYKLNKKVTQLQERLRRANKLRTA